MFELKYEQKINIGHFLSLDYDSLSTENHGHIVTINIECISNRLNANNMIIDTDLFKNYIDRFDKHSFNNYMRNNGIAGNATLENLLVLIKIKALNIIAVENNKYSTNVILKRVSVKDEEGRTFIINYS